MKQILMAAAAVFLVAGCAKPVEVSYMGVVVEKYGQCINSGKAANLTGERECVAYACNDNIVVLGQPFGDEGERHVTIGQIKRTDSGFDVEEIEEVKLEGVINSRCELKPETGRCRAYFKKYYFDSDKKSCEEFVWGGCGGVVPFHSKSECEKSCL